MRILVVDDEKLLVKGVKFNLENEGYEVECAYDGAGTQRNRGAVLTAGDLSLNTEERVAIRDGKTVDLTAKEYDLIELLMRNPRRVYSRENLMNVVWGYAYAGDYRTVDVHIRRLREKLEKNPAEPEYIMTKWGVGYYFKG